MRKFALVAVAFLIGCATITKGSKQTIAVTSNVDGAAIYLDGVRIGETPFKGEVKKNKKEIRVEKAGYRDGEIVLSKTMEAIFWGNILIGGTLGSSTDFVTGAAYTYAPATYHVELKSEGMSMLNFQRQLAVRKFSMLYIDQISRELGQGEGEYLSTLLSYMDIPEQSGSIAKIRSALEASRGDQAAFGQAVVNLL